VKKLKKLIHGILPGIMIFSFCFFALAANSDFTVVAHFPSNGAKNVPLNSEIKIFFNKVLDEKTINIFNVTLNDGKADISNRVFVKEAGKAIKIVPDALLLPARTYKVILSKDIKGINGETLSTDFSFIFTTRKLDKIHPVVIKTFPMDFEENVNVKREIIIYFSEPIDSKTIKSDSLVLFDSKNNIVKGKVHYNSLKQTLLFVPLHPLKYSETYTAILKTGICDLAGNDMLNSISFKFKTEPAPDTTPPEIIRIRPFNGATNVSIRTKIYATVSEPLDEATVNAFTVKLKGPEKDVEGYVTYDAKKLLIIFIPTKPLKYDTEYKFIMKSTITDLARNPLKKDKVTIFHTMPAPDHVRPSIKIINLKDKTMGVPRDFVFKIVFSEPIKPVTINEYTVYIKKGKNKIPIETKYESLTNTLFIKPKSIYEYSQVYKLVITKGIMDLASNNLKNGVIIRYEIEKEPDKLPPRITFVEPGVGEENVPCDSVIKIYFDESIDKSSLNPFNILVSDGKKKLFSVISYDDSLKVAIVKVKRGLTPDKVHKVIVKNIKDKAGNKMKEVETWTFKTAPPKDTRAPEIIETYPVNQATNVPVDIVIRLKLSEEIKPITANEFTVRLYQGKKKVKADIKYKNRVIYITPLKNLRFGITYKLIVKGTIEDLNGNRPGKDFQLVFKTEPVGPRILYTSPKPDEKEVDVTSNIVICFDRAMDETSFDKFLVKVYEKDKPIRFKKIYYPHSMRLVLIPFSRLKFNTQYEVVLMKGIKDKMGHRLTGDFKFKFKTMSKAQIAGIDLAEAYTYFELNPFKDVKREHWAFNVIKELVRRGYLKKYPFDGFNGKSGISRYEMAMIINRLLKSMNNIENLNRYDAMLVEKLIIEFAEELNAIGAKISDFELKLRKMSIEIAELKDKTLKMKKHARSLKLKAYEAVKMLNNKLLAFTAFMLLL